MSTNISMKDKLEKQIKEKGSISSDDVSSIAADAPVGKSPEDKMKETDTVVVSDKVKNSSILKAAAEGDPQEEINKDMAESVKPLDKFLKIVTGDEEPEEKITITPEQKQAFVDSIVANKRFVLSFSLFNGKLEGEFQSRTQNESFAIFEQLNRELSDTLSSQLAYSIRLRNMLLTAQLTRLNGDHFTGLAHPLFKTVEADKTTEPGWLSQVDYWITKDDGVVAMLYKELRKFEYRYLTMLENADNQNFWKTDLST